MNFAPNTLAMSLYITLIASHSWAVSPPIGRLRNPPLPLTQFPVVSVDMAERLLKDDELVLGVAINGETRAYPLNLINHLEREVLNDTLGSRRIVVTWCKNCFSGVVYSRDVQGRRLTFQVYGLWKGGMVLRDMETKSVWSQILGRAIKGEMDGVQLQRIPSTLTIWKTWLEKYSDTTVAQVPRATFRFNAGSYEDLSEFVLGISLGDRRLHFSFSDLYNKPMVQGRIGRNDVAIVFLKDTSTGACFNTRVDGQRLTFQLLGNNMMIDRQTKSLWDPITGLAVEGPMQGKVLDRVAATVLFRRDWEKFYPDSKLGRP